MKLTDESLMPFGKYGQGGDQKKMKDVPADYLLWMNDNLIQQEENGAELRDDQKALLEYVQDNKEAIEKEVE